PRFHLDATYSPFGRVIGGMNYVDAIERGEPPANPSRILRASIGADNIPPPRPGEVIPSAARAAPPAAAPAATPPAAQTGPKADPQPQ
ncbi:MAG TPA: peptidylprolyl isomerase, partial [Allosphingosinicella sp.]|nr:peptidylprolyl isomerase [Allosphingosinicella sp.]